MKILIVDDIEANLYLLRSMLESQHYEVMETRNGREALEQARAERPDIIISDILMPVMDGFALCRAWVKDPDLKSIPFVFYTATYTEPKDKEFALSLGAIRFLVKPMPSNEMLQEIAQIARSEGPSVRAVTPQPAGVEEEKDYYRAYNARLIHKLEDKLVQLEEQNYALQQKDTALRELNQSLEQRVTARTAELERTNKELEAFSYSVSHDLRAPLRVIKGFGEALLEDYADKLDEAGQDYLRRMRAATLQMGELLDAMLSLSRVTQGTVQNEMVDLSALAREIVEVLKMGSPEREVQIQINDTEPVYGDPQLLKIALQNLLWNAWKFTSKKPDSRIEFGFAHQADKPAFYVRDNGAGFDMRYTQRLFQAFHRLHGSEYEGTGIGLATVARVIHRHGGEVWAESRVNEGATFYFTVGAV
jgi:signal transduction histidine kinase